MYAKKNEQELKFQTQPQGVKKPQSVCLGQVYFPLRQVTFSPHLPHRLEFRQVVRPINF